MEHRYNSNKVLDYKRTPSKSKKRTLNGSANGHSFINSSKHGSRYNIKDSSMKYSKDFNSDRRSKSKKYDKRSTSNGIRKTRDLYLDAESKGSPRQNSNKKDKSYYKRYEDSMKKGSKGKKNQYSKGISYVFSNSNTSGVKVLKQHNIVKKHIDYKGSNAGNSSFQYQIMNEMFTQSSPKEILNQSTSALKKNSLHSQKMHKSRRMNGFKAPPHKSRDQSHYRINSSSHTNKMSDNRSSSMVHHSELTPLHSNCIKTVKTKQTNEDSLIGSNAYKVSTMENSLKKNVKKTLNLSSNQYHEYPTTTDWHSSLVNPADDNVEELHHCFVLLCQKKNRVIERVEKVKRTVLSSGKRSKRKISKRSGSTKRRRGEPYETNIENEAQYEYITQKNSNVEL